MHLFMIIKFLIIFYFISAWPYNRSLGHTKWFSNEDVLWRSEGSHQAYGTQTTLASCFIHTF